MTCPCLVRSSWETGRPRPGARKFYLTRHGVRMLLLALPLIGYGATLTSDATLADVLLAGMVLAVFGAWRRWARFRGEKPAWY